MHLVLSTEVISTFSVQVQRDLGMGADFKTKTRELRSGCYYVLPIPTHRVNTGIIIHSFIHSLIPPICVRHLLGSHV